jgi:16S rRNA (cytosine967-C5)-methyltransferase
MLDPQPGEAILDACAAPGGKTAMIAERLQGRGRLVAVDAQESRCRRLEENLRRMRAGAVEVVCADMRDTLQHNAANATLFDRILLDVPCSNTGVLRRRPDARWRFAADKLTDLGRLQTALLDASARRLRPGGVLVYSTCSLEPEENSRGIAAWIATHAAFRLERDQLLFPPATGCDGAYAARLTTSA